MLQILQFQTFRIDVYCGWKWILIPIELLN